MIFQMPLQIPPMPSYFLQLTRTAHGRDAGVIFEVLETGRCPPDRAVRPAEPVSSAGRGRPSTCHTNWAAVISLQGCLKMSRFRVQIAGSRMMPPQKRNCGIVS
jgi:hypothetical protein